MTVFNITSGQHGLHALLTRAVALQSDAVARIQLLPNGDCEVFVTTPFDVIASRRVTAELTGQESIFPASELLAGALTKSIPNSWPGALPPVGKFEQLDIIPVDVVHQLLDQGKDLARSFSGPLGPPKSLLDQEVLQVSGGGKTAAVTMRMIFACNSLGLIPGRAARPEIPRHVRVAVAGRWVRLDAPFGSVYQSQGLSLLI
ncbi:hypothetical protein [Corynebacterium epidermidicanis]|uniref:Uncharacterized protein n=1 Tax=Corynebacterium epidermidicanis TaxID=1050174 RepID=A0A0G3GTE0_9CORY|nr:hypothetical protein [Corynebacterium epidermidicanis]AKK03810.1 hypothetical protein CEPID_09835 [Corynebacterium epidermidicanis]